MSLLQRGSVALSALFLAQLVACGGSIPSLQTSSPITVSVSAPIDTVQVGGKVQFTATVTNTKNTAVYWAVQAIGAIATSDIGTISNSGLYTAPTIPPTPPPTPTKLTIIAASQADSSVQGSFTLTVTPLPVTISISPKAPSVQAGATLKFMATVKNAADTSVTWQVNSVTGGTSTLGTISTNGTYTAPTTIPTIGIMVDAVSNADSTKAAFTTVTITPPPEGVVVTITPSSVSLQPSKSQTFTATVTNVSDQSVTWSVIGGNLNGTISTSGVYVAPDAVPTPATVTINATSKAVPTAVGAATATITPPPTNVAVSVAPSSVNLQTNTTEQFSATVTNVGDQSVTWQVSGGGTISSSGLYSAPNAVPANPIVIITASNAASGVFGTATATLTQSPVPASVTVFPRTANVKAGGGQNFAASVANATDTTVIWNVDGVPGGNSTVGTITAQGLYSAPVTAPPAPATVTISAVSNADQMKSDSATVTIQSGSDVTVAPPVINLIPGQSQQFSANISNGGSQDVTWSISGKSCIDVACGSITSAGDYTAPTVMPTPDPTVTATATSATNSTISGTATVTITAVPTPTVQISPPTPPTVMPAIPSLQLGLGQKMALTAAVTLDPSNQVTWSSACIDDGETPPDCTADSEGDAPAETFTLVPSGPSSVELTAPMAPDQGKGYILEVTATSVAQAADGTQGKATIRIVVPVP